MNIQNKEKIIILGAGGFVGQRLIEDLYKDKDFENKYELLLFTRNKRKLKHLKEKYTNIIVVDIPLIENNFNKLVKTFKNVKSIYYLIHLLDNKNFIEKEKSLANLIGKAAENAEVKQIIYLGNIGDDVKNKSKHLESRILTGKILRRYNTPVVEFKTATILGTGSFPFKVIQHLATKLPFLIRSKDVILSEPVFIDNVIYYLKLALYKPEIFNNKILELGESEYKIENGKFVYKTMYTYNDLIKIYAKTILNKELKEFKVSNFIFKKFISLKITKYIVHMLVNQPFEIIDNLFTTLTVNTIRREEYKIENQLPKELLAPKYTLEEIYKIITKRINTGEVFIINEYPNKYNHLSKKDHLVLDNSYIINEDYSLLPKELEKNLWKNINKFACSIQDNCWSSNFIWKFNGFINNILGGMNLKTNTTGTSNITNLKVGDVIGIWEVDNIKEENNIKELRLVSLLNSPGTEYLQFKITSLNDKKNIGFIIRNIYIPNGLRSLIHWYSFYPIQKKVLKNIKYKLIKYTKKEYIINNSNLFS